LRLWGQTQGFAAEIRRWHTGGGGRSARARPVRTQEGAVGRIGVGLAQQQTSKYVFDTRDPD